MVDVLCSLLGELRVLSVARRVESCLNRLKLEVPDTTGPDCDGSGDSCWPPPDLRFSLNDERAEDDILAPHVILRCYIAS